MNPCLVACFCFLGLRTEKDDTVWSWSTEFVSCSCYGYSLFTMCTHMRCSVQFVNERQEASLYICYTVGCFNTHAYSVWDVCLFAVNQEPQAMNRKENSILFIFALQCHWELAESYANSNIIKKNIYSKANQVAVEYPPSNGTVL